MTTTQLSPLHHPPLTRPPLTRRSPVTRFFGVLGKRQTWANTVYVLLGLPVGTIGFLVIVTGLSLGLGLLVVALAGIPVLVGLWHAVHALAGVERRTAAALLRQPIPAPTLATPAGNLWARLQTLSTDRVRWRELAYLLLRFPVGVVTSITAVALVGAALTISWAPFERRLHDQPWGDWRFGSDLEAVASSSPWSWLLLPTGLLLLVASLHAIDVMASGCGRWAASWLSPSSGPDALAGDAGPRPSFPATMVDRWALPVPAAPTWRTDFAATSLVRFHAVGFATVAAVLLLIDVVTGGGLWSRWPLIAWASVLGFHAVVVRRRDLWSGPRRRAVLHVHAALFASVMTMLVAFDVAGGGGWWSQWPLIVWAPIVAGHAALASRGPARLPA